MATTELLLCVNTQHILPYAYLYIITLRDKREDIRDRRQEIGIREDRNYIKRLCSQKYASSYIVLPPFLYTGQSSVTLPAWTVTTLPNAPTIIIYFTMRYVQWL